MKKNVPFSKEIPFKTRIAEITDIEVTHDLTKTPYNTIEGNFLVSGSYKMTDATQIEEKFSHELPFIIDVDDRYDLEDVKIKISDFFFEIVNDDILKINIEIELDDINEKQVELEKESDKPVEEVREDSIKERCYDDEEDDNLEVEIASTITKTNNEEKQEKVEPIDILDSEIPKALEVEKTKNVTKNTENVVNATSISEIFTSINQDEDNFMTYYVHIVRDNDTLDDILTKYKVTREEISEYNDLDNIKIGTKLILPCVNNEQ